MLIAALALGVVLGLLARGDILNLARVRLRWAAIIFVALVVRFATELALTVDVVQDLRLPLFGLGYALLIAGLWVNRGQPGLSLAFVGVLANAIAITLNGGAMPVWEPSLAQIGLDRSALTPGGFYDVVPLTELDTTFITSGVLLGDIIPLPLPVVPSVISVGDLFLAAGLAFFLFATIVRSPDGLLDEEAELVRRRVIDVATDQRDPRRHETGLRSGLLEASALERPALLGSSAAGLLATSAAAGAEAGIAAPTIPAPPSLAERARRHPYVRLSLNPAFSALWAGQLISLLGDRIHQIALAFLVLGATNSAIALGAVFVAATLPNLLFGPIAGTLVDRWDEREVLIVSDILRAAIVLLLPVAALIDILFVYPLVFLMTTVSIFFRPARVSILPRLVEKDDLIVANSAMWVGESFADIGGYALAGLFVAFLGSSLPLAFWIDSVSYIASALLLATIVVRPRPAPEGGEAPTRNIARELREGWAFLRHETVLLGNTLQGVAGQAMIGVLLALMPIYARDAIEGGILAPETVLAFLESGIGLGNLIGGFVVGLVGSRIRLGRMVILGYAMTGVLVALLGLTGDLGLALGLIFGVGAGNLVFVIPSQTLFQQRTPPALMGRVIGFRFSLVFGAMTVAAAIAGVLGELLGPGPVIALFGVITVGAGLGALLVPALRDA